jgi:protein-glutamine gamma-glutamyltransferase
MENSRPQLNLTELIQLRWLLGGVLGLLSAWTLFYMEVDVLVALIALTVVVPVFTVAPRLAMKLPVWGHRLAFPLIVTAFAFDWWQGREILPAMIRLDLMLLGYRCVAPRGRREDLQLILLSLFAVVVTGVFTVSIAFVIQILLFTACALALLLAVTISDARSGDGQESAAGWERVHWRLLAARIRKVSDWRVVALGSALFGGVVGLTAVLFLAIPRFEISSSLFIDRLMSHKSLTGFTENVRFGDVTSIQEDKSMAFAVDVDPALVPAEPYWRMLVLDEYTTEGFRMSAGLKRDFFGRERSTTHRGSRRGETGGGDWTVFYQPNISRYLPLLGGFGQITFGEPQVLSQNRALRLVSLANESSKVVGYHIEGMDTGGLIFDPDFAGLLSGDDPPERRYHRRRWMNREESTPAPPTFLALGLAQPEDLARLASWVDELGGRGAGGGDLARRAGNWLQARHSYSLHSSIPPGEGDPLVRWIASAEPGHCELFAGALVILVRSAGVPARMVTGFKGGAWNQLSGGIRVLNSDAHAWCEVWDEAQEAWLRVDPTPGAVMIAANETAASSSVMGSMPPDDSWGARLDGVRIFWYRGVINFDSASQGTLLRSTKEVVQAKSTEMRMWIETWVEAWKEWLRTPWDWMHYAGVATSALLLAAALVFWRRAGRAWWLGWRSSRTVVGREDPMRREASRWLRQVGFALTGEGAGAPHDGLLRVREQLLRLRFGARETWPEPAAVFRTAQRELRSARRARLRPASAAAGQE